MAEASGPIGDIIVMGTVPAAGAASTAQLIGSSLGIASAARISAGEYIVTLAPNAQVTRFNATAKATARAGGATPATGDELNARILDDGTVRVDNSASDTPTDQEFDLVVRRRAVGQTA